MKETALPSGALINPAAERNKRFILEVLQQRLPSREGQVLEVSTGTGQHVALCAAALPGIQWRPSDVTAHNFHSIDAHATGLPNVSPPVVLDTRWPPERWPLQPGEQLDAMLAVNLTHIAPWDATAGLLAGARHWLREGGQLFIYGPFLVNGRHTSDSNMAFDVSLRQQNADWGYRDVQGDIMPAAAAVGLQLTELVPMPANNFTLVLRRVGAPAAGC